MNELSEKQISDNWDELLNIIRTEIPGEKGQKLAQLHEHFGERAALAPASGKEHFHNAFPGGYVHHILNVIRLAKKLQKVWEEAGTRVNYTPEELVFSCVCHDLGKMGSLDKDYYVPNTSDWHRKNQGKIYELNPELNFMHVTDRAYFLLLHFGITITENEFLSIRLADGLYSDVNKAYMMGYDDNFALKTNLPFIVHAADFLAMHSEYDTWKVLQLEQNEAMSVAEPAHVKSHKKKTLADVVTDPSTKGIDLADFDKLFGETK